MYGKAIAAMRELQIPRYLRYNVRGEHHGLSLYFVTSGHHRFLNASPVFDGRDFTGHGTARYDSSDGAGAFTDSSGKDIVGCVPFPLGPEVRAFVRTGTAEPAADRPAWEDRVGSVGEYWLVKHVHIEAAGHLLLTRKGGSLDYFFDGYTFPSTIPPMW